MKVNWNWDVVWEMERGRDGTEKEDHLFWIIMTNLAYNKSFDFSTKSPTFKNPHVLSFIGLSTQYTKEKN